MQTVTNEQIYSRWEQIPEILREAFVSIDNGALIWKACEDAGLPEEVIDNVLVVVGNVIFGFTHINDLARELQSIPSIDQKAVDPIIFQIDRKIFAPIKGEILKLYSEMSGTGPRIMMEARPEQAEAVRPQAMQVMGQPKRVSEVAVPSATQPPKAVSEVAPATLQATQFETRKIRIEEEAAPAAKIEERSIEAPAMIHTEEIAAPVVARKHELSSFGGMFGFRRKSSSQDEGPVVAAQINAVQSMGKKPEVIGHTEQQQVKVVHYTDARGPEDIFGQAKQQAQQEHVSAMQTVNTFEPKNILPPRAEEGVASPIPPQQFGGAVEMVSPVVVMKTPQRPEPLVGAKKLEPEPRLTEIPVSDDIVDLRMLEQVDKK